MRCAEWQDFFDCLSKYCPLMEIVFLFVSMIQFSIQYHDAQDQRGDSYQVQKIERHDTQQTYQAYDYYVTKENVTISSQENLNCHVYDTFEEANLTQNFISYFSTGGSLPWLATFYYIVFILQLIGLSFNVYYKMNKIKVEDKSQEQILKFGEQSSTLVVYYFGTLLIPILSIDYSEDCVSSYFTFIFDLSPFVPYVGAIIIIILGTIFLAICCNLEVPNPSLFIVSYIITEYQKREEQENRNNQNNNDDGSCYLIVFVMIIVIVIIIFPTINAFRNNDSQITVVCIFSFLITVLSGVKDWFKGNQNSEGNRVHPQ